VGTARPPEGAHTVAEGKGTPVNDKTEPITLKGLTWAHPRGYDPLVACASRYAQLTGHVRIEWRQRSLHDFGAAPIWCRVTDHLSVRAGHRSASRRCIACQYSSVWASDAPCAALRWLRAAYDI